MAEYLLLIYSDESAMADASEEDAATMMKSYGEYTAVARGPGVDARRRRAPGTDQATSVRVTDGERIVTDGPFAETKEQLGGYYLIEVDNLDDAIEAAGRCPGAHRHDRGPTDPADVTSDPAEGGPGRPTEEVVGQLFRRESGRAVATLIRVLGDFDLAEEAVQEAFVVALDRWPRDGLPDKPGAWITTTARNRAIDRLRREARLRDEDGGPGTPHRPGGARATSPCDIPDDRLRLIFTCCHPALPLDARVALTLRTVGGLTHAGDRARVPAAGADRGPASRASQEEDPRRVDPLPRAPTSTCWPSAPAASWRSYISSSTRDTPPPRAT